MIYHKVKVKVTVKVANKADNPAVHDAILRTLDLYLCRAVRTIDAINVTRVTVNSHGQWKKEINSVSNPRVLSCCL